MQKRGRETVNKYFIALQTVLASVLSAGCFAAEYEDESAADPAVDDHDAAEACAASIPDEQTQTPCPIPQVTLNLSNGVLVPPWSLQVDAYTLEVELDTESIQVRIAGDNTLVTDALLDELPLPQHGFWELQLHELHSGVLQLQLTVSGEERLYTVSIQPNLPTWATNTGWDEFGQWATFKVDNLEQRLRRLPAGTFHMGSPANETERADDELPSHEVRLTHSFWMADTETQQDLWIVVMGTDPSYFPGASRPVEQVSWEDTQEFFKRLNEQVPGLTARLPTEAEWEYACRAGTDTSTYIGDSVVLGQRNAPLVDPIAWYGGNSGIDFELNEGRDTSEWLEKQYPDTVLAGTHPVAQRAPNPWGLYDMLGNVWEWCADYYGAYGQGPDTNPTGPATNATERVLRGGSWLSHAIYVRAAARLPELPTHKVEGLGFRIAASP